MAVLAALKRNPVVFVPVLAWSLVQAPEVLVREVNPALAGVLTPGRMLLTIFATPFFHAGILGMAAEALDGYTSLDAFAAAATANYLPMLLASLLVLAANAVFGVFALLGVLLGALAVLMNGPSLLGLLAGAVGALALVAYLVVLVLLQFYGHAIVLDDTGAVAGLKRSVALVRGNRLRVLGYSVVGGAVALVYGLGLVASAFVLGADRSLYGLPATGLPPAGVAVGILLIAVLQALAGSWFATYSVAFYRRVSGGADDADDGANDAAGRPVSST